MIYKFTENLRAILAFCTRAEFLMMEKNTLIVVDWSKKLKAFFCEPDGVSTSFLVSVRRCRRNGKWLSYI